MKVYYNLLRWSLKRDSFEGFFQALRHYNLLRWSLKHLTYNLYYYLL